MVDLIVMVASAVSVHPRIKLDTVVPVLGHVMQQAMRVLQLPVLIVDELFGDPKTWQGTVL